MANISIADKIIFRQEEALIMAEIATQDKLLNSAAVEIDNNSVFKGGGVYSDRVRIAEPTGDLDLPVTGVENTPQTISSLLESKVQVTRTKTWSEDDVAVRKSGYSSIKSFLGSLPLYLRKQYFKTLLSILDGLYDDTAGCLKTTHRAVETTNKITLAAIFSGKSLLGDIADELSLMIMNSKTYFDAIQSGIATYAARTQLSNVMATTGALGIVAGIETLVSDLVLPNGDGNYPVYMMANKSLKFSTPFFRLENERKGSLGAGTEIVTMNTDFEWSIPGTSFVKTNETNPTNATLATASSWAKTGVDDKLIKVIQLLVK